MKSPIVVCGATGNVGRRIVEALLAAGEPVRVIGRERVRLGPLAARGADPLPGDLEDTAFLESAFSGARAAFVLIPPKLHAPDLRRYQNKVSDAIVSALAKAKVPRVVTLSSIGAHLPEGTGPILGLHDLEEKLAGLPAAAVHLRPGYFHENHLWSIPAIRSQGVNIGALRPEAPIPMVATEDIASEASRLLLRDSFSGREVRYLLGPKDYTMSEVTRILGKSIGTPALQYIPAAEEDMRRAMTGMGMSRSVVEAMLEMYRGFNAGKIRPTRERGPESTTPTTLEDFAESVFAPAYRAAA
ncbi:MAG: NAD(P)H-binding protein [Thermodesulfobacteriota bacterium]